MALNIQSFNLENADLSFHSRIVQRLSHQRQVAGEETTDSPQPLALYNSESEDVARMYYKIIYSKFGEGRLSDEIMQEILKRAFRMYVYYIIRLPF